MGSQPATLDTSLIKASSSADTQPPTCTISSMSVEKSSGSGPDSHPVVKARGAARDVDGGVVGGVEVAIGVAEDGSLRWHPADVCKFCWLPLDQ